MIKKTLTTLLCLLPLACLAQNPIIHDQFTADPTARVFNGKVYLFPSHDIISPVEPERRWFSMADYHVFSSEDLVNWEDHGVIVKQEDVPWGKPNGYSMWAPDCVYKNRKYYFYFPDAPKQGFGFAVGVAIANNPEGPYEIHPEPVKGVTGIDPCVLNASDGNSYIYWHARGLTGAMLNDNMTEIDGKAKILDANFPKGQKEGPFVFERNGKFYLTYPWVQNKTENIAYAISDSPLGPFEFKGIIMQESGSLCWTNHHSIVEYKGQWYFFYHHNDYSPGFDKNRSVRIEKLTFSPDGTIQPIVPTFRGVGVTKATDRIQIDRYSKILPNATAIDFLNPDNTFEGWFVSLLRPGSWVQYNEVTFGDNSPKTITIRARSTKGAKVAFTENEESPEFYATVNVPKSKDFKEITVKLTKEVKGLQYVRAFLQEGDIDIDWVSFK